MPNVSALCSFDLTEEEQTCIIIKWLVDNSSNKEIMDEMKKDSLNYIDPRSEFNTSTTI